MPSITSSIASEVKVEIYEDKTLTCSATGIPRPSITWVKDTVTITNDLEKFTISLDGMTLTIHNMTDTESGCYSCEAQNEAGTKLREFNLTVVGMHLTVF